MSDRSPVLELAGWAVHAPGLDHHHLPGSPAEAACAPEDAKLVLGRRGLLGKEPATRLALCAVHRVLGLPPGPVGAVPGAAGTAVVVASNLGNVDTVCSLLDTMRERGAAAVSPLDAPNASSNVIASTLAIRYGFTGPNLTICSGATAGLDALRLAALLIGAGRAERAIVVGVEPGDDIAVALAARTGTPTPPLRAVAACVLVGRAGAWDDAAAGSERIELGRVEISTAPARRAAVPSAADADADDLLAGAYGAAGVVAVAVAAAGSDADRTVVCGDPVDGYRAVTLTVRARATA